MDHLDQSIILQTLNDVGNGHYHQLKKDKKRISTGPRSPVIPNRALQ